MGAGVTLMVVGAILAFAVTADPEGISLPTVGVILMIAGAAVIWNARHEVRHVRIITKGKRRKGAQSPHAINDPSRETDD